MALSERAPRVTIHLDNSDLYWHVRWQSPAGWKQHIRTFRYATALVLKHAVKTDRALALGSVLLHMDNRPLVPDDYLVGRRSVNMDPLTPSERLELELLIPMANACALVRPTAPDDPTFAGIYRAWIAYAKAQLTEEKP